VRQSISTISLIRVIIGLFIYGGGLALMVSADIGLSPWDVLAMGISIQTTLSFGWATVLVSGLVLLLWIPLKVKLGVGSVLNAVLVGLFADLWLLFLPSYELLISKIAVFAIGTVTIGLATGLYISAGLGKGPRDGLMVGTAEKTKKPFWMVRSFYEILVLVIGFSLGGPVGLGTIIFVVSIGYLTQLGLQLFKLADRKGIV
jgi:Predicted membrane protein